MITVTMQDMLDFIAQQPDDKAVSFDDIHSTDSCGCVMVQYGWHAGFDFDHCAIAHWGKLIKDERTADVAYLEKGISFSTFRPQGTIPGEPTTFGAVKNHLRGQGYAI